MLVAFDDRNHVGVESIHPERVRLTMHHQVTSVEPRRAEARRCRGERFRALQLHRKVTDTARIDGVALPAGKNGTEC